MFLSVASEVILGEPPVYFPSLITCLLHYSRQNKPSFPIILIVNFFLSFLSLLICLFRTVFMFHYPPIALSTLVKSCLKQTISEKLFFFLESQRTLERQSVGEEEQHHRKQETKLQEQGTEKHTRRKRSSKRHQQEETEAEIGNMYGMK